MNCQERYPLNMYHDLPYGERVRPRVLSGRPGVRGRPVAGVALPDFILSRDVQKTARATAAEPGETQTIQTAYGIFSTAVTAWG